MNEEIENFGPKAGHWKKFSKSETLSFASQIAGTLLKSQYEDFWKKTDPALAFDPAEFFTTTKTSAPTSFDLS
jgi:hypothetical protein